MWNFITDFLDYVINAKFFIGWWQTSCYPAIREATNFQFCVAVTSQTGMIISGLSTLTILSSLQTWQSNGFKFKGFSVHTVD
jgi:hypothetical protein